MAHNGEPRDQAVSRPAPRVTAVDVADQLQRELESHGITADVNDGYGLAVVSVSRGLAVWTNGDLYWWCAGWNDRRDRAVYAWHPTEDSKRAARRVAARYEDLRKSVPKHPRPPFPTGDPA